MQQGKTKAMVNAKRYYESKNPNRKVTGMLDFNQVYVVSSVDKKNPNPVDADGLQSINKETKEIRAFIPSALHNPDAYFDKIDDFVSFEEDSDMGLYQKQQAEIQHGLFGWGKRKPNTKPVNPDYQDPNFKQKSTTYVSTMDYRMRLDTYLASHDQKIRDIEASVADAERKLNAEKAKLLQAKKDRLAAKSVFDRQYSKSTMVTMKP